MKNTGVLDMNMDGIPEKINNDIKAMAFQLSAEAYMSISSYGTGQRVNDIVPTVITRQVGLDRRSGRDRCALGLRLLSCCTNNIESDFGQLGSGFQRRFRRRTIRTSTRAG